MLYLGFISRTHSTSTSLIFPFSISISTPRRFKNSSPKTNRSIFLLPSPPGIASRFRIERISSRGILQFFKEFISESTQPSNIKHLRVRVEMSLSNIRVFSLLSILPCIRSSNRPDSLSFSKLSRNQLFASTKWAVCNTRPSKFLRDILSTLPSL